MEVKVEYKNMDFELKMNKRIQAKYKEKSDLELNEFLERYNLSLTKAKVNNWIDTYKIISILVEKVNDIKYTFIQVKNEIFDEMSLGFVWLVLNDEGEIIKDKYFRYETKDEYETRINNGIIKCDKAIIEIDEKYKSKIESTLDCICNNWNEKIYIRYINCKSNLGEIFDVMFKGKISPEFIEELKDSEMYKALGMNKF